MSQEVLRRYKRFEDRGGTPLFYFGLSSFPGGVALSMCGVVLMGGYTSTWGE